MIRNLAAIELGHPVYRMRDVVDESADGSGIREIHPETFRKYVRQKAGCATFGAMIIVERLSIFNRTRWKFYSLQSTVYSLSLDRITRTSSSFELQPLDYNIPRILYTSSWTEPFINN